MTRDDDFAALAKEYARQQGELDAAEAAEREARKVADAARHRMGQTAKLLGDFVGASVRVRCCIVGDAVVRVEHEPREGVANRVTIEQAVRAK